MMKLAFLIAVAVPIFASALSDDELSADIVEYSESDQSSDDGNLENQELNEMELELFSKLLSPNDTTLQQGTKSLLAKYIISQILSNKKNPGKPAPAPAAPLPAAAAPVPAIQEIRIPDTISNRIPESPPSTEATTQRATTRRQAPVREQAQGDLTTARVRVTPAPEHVLGQVDKILGNVATGNIIGIVDESLAIRAPAPVRSLVNGILKLVFCNPLDRLMNRCRGSDAGGAGNLQPVPVRAPRPPQGVPASGTRGTRRPLFGII